MSFENLWLILDNKYANTHQESLGGRLYPVKHVLGNVSTRVATSAAGRRALKAELDRLVQSADRPGLVASDPVELVHAYDDPNDQEVAGLLVAMLAYGRVASIKAKATTALEALGPSPARAVDAGRRPAKLQGFVYRFQRDADVPRFLRAVGAARRKHGSLGQMFARIAAATPESPTYVEAMDGFIAELTGFVRGPMTYGLRYMLPRTSAQGAAKRLCLYLRWMIRPDDGLDLGTWQRLAPGVDPSRLLMPLDTHIARISRNLALTARASNDLKTAVEITEALRALRPDDPLLYDMALCHLGISGACPQRRDPEICADCDLNPICRLPA